MNSIERVNELIKEKHANWIGISNQVAIKEVLDELGTAKREVKQYEKALHDQIIKDYDMELDLKQKLEKKEKIIDAMADALKFSFNSGINFFPSSICKCEGDIRKCEGKICTECIKQYFEKKVGE